MCLVILLLLISVSLFRQRVALLKMTFLSSVCASAGYCGSVSSHSTTRSFRQTCIERAKYDRDLSEIGGWRSLLIGVIHQ